MHSAMRGSRGGVGGGSGPPLEFAKLKIADITENEKIGYFSYLCTSTFIRQGWIPPGKNFWIRACSAFLLIANFQSFFNKTDLICYNEFK